jgi:hypothetical protein
VTLEEAVEALDARDWQILVPSSDFGAAPAPKSMQ